MFVHLTVIYQIEDVEHMTGHRYYYKTLFYYLSVAHVIGNYRIGNIASQLISGAYKMWKKKYVFMKNIFIVLFLYLLLTTISNSFLTVFPAFFFLLYIHCQFINVPRVLRLKKNCENRRTVTKNSWSPDKVCLIHSTLLE